MKNIPNLETFPRSIRRLVLRHADKIAWVSNEGADGYWVALNNGWWNAEASTTALHEYSAKDMAQAFSWIRPHGQSLNA